MLKIDLNCDLGESFGVYTLGMDEDVLPLITSANIACGFHASDPVTMAKTVRLAADSGIAVGAHPGFPDLLGFGRRNMNVSPSEAKAYIQYQIGALSAFAKSCGVRLSHVKPHGALYNMAGKDMRLAEAICEGIAELDESLILLALSGSAMIEAAKRKGLRAAREVFADRAYEPDGSLVARTKPGAVIADENEAAFRIIRMIQEKKVRAVDGTDLDMEADSVCIHGDSIHALEFAKKLRASFSAAGIEAAPLKDVVL